MRGARFRAEIANFCGAVSTLSGHFVAARLLQLDDGQRNGMLHQREVRPLHDIRDKFDVAHIATLDAPVR